MPKLSVQSLVKDLILHRTAKGENNIPWLTSNYNMPWVIHCKCRFSPDLSKVQMVYTV